ncbi:hypothetical protein Bbelb_230870 [Branchiostoma belcheri]|nr:hypothetical protein Bbelb_230870 [Branchiostoma belcheri]
MFRTCLPFTLGNALPRRKQIFIRRNFVIFTAVSGANLRQQSRIGARACVTRPCVEEFAVSVDDRMAEVALTRPTSLRLPGPPVCGQRGRVATAARRQLFGPVDHDQLRSDWTREIARIVEEKGRQWNFDFGRETPLEGDYSWEKVGSGEQRCRGRELNTCTLN